MDFIEFLKVLVLGIVEGLPNGFPSAAPAI